METEAKFIVPDAATFDRIRATTQFGSYTRTDEQVKPVHDRYVDTADYRFYGHQYYARLRESKGTLLLTLKSLGNAAAGAIHAREEYQTEVPGLSVSAWPPGDVRRLAEEIAGDAPLTDLVTFDQTRHVSILREGERAVAELSLDEVVVAGPQGPVRAYELEAELLPDGTPADLDALCRVFGEDYGLTGQPQSKFERALALAGIHLAPAPASTPSTNGYAPGAVTAPLSPAALPPDPDAVRPTDSMAGAGRKILHKQLAALEKNEDGVRAGDDADAVHDMRVATRRMRAALRLMEDYEQSKTFDRVRREARALARALGGVRDLDVLIEHAQAFQAALPAGQQPDLDGLLAAWRTQRKRARKRLLRLLDSAAYPRFKDHLSTLLARPPAPPDQAAGAVPYEVRHVAGSAIWTHYEAVRAYEGVIDTATVPQLHALRIECKYLRYTLEFFRDVLAPEAEGLIGEVVTAQDQLGQMHDADVAADLIRGYIADTYPARKKKPAPPPPPGLEVYLAARAATVQDIAAHFAETTWARLNSLHLRQRLATVIAAL
jgi:CHAD domain-containing protein